MDAEVIAAANALASSRQMACPDDIFLLVATVSDLKVREEAVQLGAGSGTMSLAILGASETIRLWTVDNDPQALNWEEQALRNARSDLPLRRVAIHSRSRAAGYRWNNGPVDLLVVDADHSFRSVFGDLRAWLPHVKPEGSIIVHDYDAETAPHQYPGVKAACDIVFKTPPFLQYGWSALFWRNQWTGHQS